MGWHAALSGRKPKSAVYIRNAHDVHAPLLIMRTVSLAVSGANVICQPFLIVCVMHMISLSSRTVFRLETMSRVEIPSPQITRTESGSRKSSAIAAEAAKRTKVAKQPERCQRIVVHPKQRPLRVKTTQKPDPKSSKSR